MYDHDTKGRKYLKLKEAVEGQTIELDEGFTCHDKGIVTLFKSEHGLYFKCNDGQHYIDGQADDGIHCIGIYP